MKIILDTNRYTDLARGDERVTQTIEAAEQTLIPIVALGELRAGFLGGTRARENEQKLSAFVNKATVRVLVPDEATTFQYAVIFQQLRRQGTPIPTNDMWIAALALQHTLRLYARDAHFDHIPQLMGCSSSAG